MSWSKLRTIKPIWAARLMLIYLLYMQVMHQQQDYGGHGIDSWLYAFAMEVSISIAISAIVTIVFFQSDNPWRFMILFGLIVVFHLMTISVDASTRVFFKNKLNQLETEQMGVVGVAAHNNVIWASRALNDLRKSGITSGVQYNQASQAYDDAVRAKQQADSTQKQSASAKALQMGDDSADSDDEALAVAKKRAWSLLGLVLLFSAVSGIWNMMTGLMPKPAGIMTETKKHQGQVHP